MIVIKGIGFFDESKPFMEQEDEQVRIYLGNKINTFNDATALDWDKWKRPVYYKYEGEGIIIESTRTYKDESPNYFIDVQSYTIKAQQDGDV